MKTYKVIIEFIGLSGRYIDSFELDARTQASANKKVYALIGNRDYNTVSVTVMK